MAALHSKTIIGLTGNPATGKTVVRMMLQRLGAFTIDAGTIAQQAMKKGAPGYQQILDQFGERILTPSGAINHQLLNSFINQDKEGYRIYNAIIQPLLCQAVEHLASQIEQQVLVVEVADLHDSPLRDLVDQVWATTLPEQVQIDRASNRPPAQQAEIQHRLKSQPRQWLLITAADVMIDNRGDIENTWKQVKTAWQQLTADAHPTPHPAQTAVTQFKEKLFSHKPPVDRSYMLRYFASRLLRGLVVTFLFLSAIFFLIQLVVPGDFAIIAGFGSGVDEIEAMRQQLGLDLPVWQRYLNWVNDLLHGNLGASFQGWNNPATGQRERIPVSFLLSNVSILSICVMLPGVFLAYWMGTTLGRVTAWRGSRLLRGGITFIGILLYTSFPPLLVFLVSQFTEPLGIWCPGCPLNKTLWSTYSTRWPWGDPYNLARSLLLTLIAAILLMLLLDQLVKRFTRRRMPTWLFALFACTIWLYGWFAFGYQPIIIDLLKQFIPMIAIFTLLTFGDTMLMMNSSMVDTMYEEYIVSARAKGLKDSQVRDAHAGRNAVLPVISRLIVNLPYVLSGLIIIEDSFNYSNFLGRYLFDSLRLKDIPMVMGALMVVGMVAMVARLVLELLIGALDPRLRTPGANQSQLLEHSNWQLRLPGLKSLFSRSRKLPAAFYREKDRGKGLLPSLKNIPHKLKKVVQHQWIRLRRARNSWKVFSANKLALFGLVLILLFAVMSLIHPLLMNTVWDKKTYDPLIGYDLKVFPHPSPPSLKNGHLLGTDSLGRDLLSMLLSSTRPSFSVAITAALSAGIIGTIIGAVSAYFHGRLIDVIFSYLADMLLIVPAPLVMVVLGERFFEEMGVFGFGLIFGLLVGAGSVAIVMRSQALKIMVSPFIQASVVAGSSPLQIIIHHMLPHMLPLAAVQMTVTVVGATISYGFLAFVGIAEFDLNWGTMVYMAKIFFKSVNSTTIPWLQFVAPAAALSLFAGAFYMVSRGLHQVAEPRLRRR